MSNNLGIVLLVTLPLFVVTILVACAKCLHGSSTKTLLILVIMLLGWMILDNVYATYVYNQTVIQHNAHLRNILRQWGI